MNGSKGLWWRRLGMLWALPLTLVAVLLALMLRPNWFGGGVRWARVRYDDTVAYAVWGGAIGWLLDRLPLNGVNGLTIGHVVFLRDIWQVREIGAHEFEHVRQYMRWGIFFPVAYGLESVWQWLRGRDYYFDNRFEVAAYRLTRQRFMRYLGRQSGRKSA